MNKYLKKIAYSNLLKGTISIFGATGLDAICRLGIVFILTRYYSKDAFGIWAAITSIAAVVVTGDLGITNALRNKISQLLTIENTDRNSQKYFYAVFYFFLISAIFFTGLLLLLSPYIPFDTLFKSTDSELQQMGVQILIFVQITFFFTIPFSIGNSLYFTYQESHIGAIFISIQALTVFFLVLFLSILNVSIVIISITYFVIGLLFSFSSSLYFIIRHRWFHFKVSWREIYTCNFELIKIGLKFMILQLSSSFLQNAGTIIASSLLSTRLAADYNMYTKLYTFGISIFQSIFNPLWGSYAAAVYNKNYIWLKKVYYSSRKIIFLIFAFFGIFICLYGNFILKLIAGNGDYHTNFMMYFMLGTSSLFFMLFNAASIIPKSCNKINILLVISLSACLIITPLSKYLLSIVGFIGLPIAISSLWIILYIVMHIQTKNIINENR